MKINSPKKELFQGRKIIIVEDDKLFQKVLEKILSKNFPKVEIEIVSTFSELKKVLEEKTFDISICDYILPDSESGEAIEYLSKKNIPTVVFTGSYDPKVRNFCLEVGVADVLFKNFPNIQEIIVSTVYRILKNLETNVLIVEDSKTESNFLKRTLEKIGLKVVQAFSLAEARKIILEKNIEFKCIILDYFLEEKSIDLLMEIRRKYSKFELGVIVVSAYLNPSVVPYVLKAGANDFIKKPFLEEEFKIKVNNLLDYLDTIEEFEFYANYDPLSHLLNRRSFFRKALEIVDIAKRYRHNLVVILFDIDYFKKINDTYGHQVGDAVIEDFASKLDIFFKRDLDIKGRYGGEEFIVLGFYEDKSQFIDYLEKFHQYVINNPLKYEDLTINYTFSAGVAFDLKEDLEEMIKRADSYLYKAKELGRNKIISDLDFIKN